MKYNFVIFALNFYCYEASYSDVIGLDNVRYINNYIPIKNKIIKLFYRIHHSNKINKIINLPFKKIWFDLYFKNDFNNNNYLCFIFFGSVLNLEKYGYVEFLKKRYANSKYVVFFQDLISLQHDIDITKLKNNFDVVMTYDQNEAKKFDLYYHPTIYSYTIINNSNNIDYTDIYFLGAAKNRFNKIVRIYNYLQSLGFKCDFYMTGVKRENQLEYKGIHYISSMSYEENLQHVIKSECILEVMQDNAQGYTMRTWEAIMYDKKLLTDNVEIKKAPYYNSYNILVFDDLDNMMDKNYFFNNFTRKVDHRYKDKISPIKLLEYVEKKLETR